MKILTSILPLLLVASFAPLGTSCTCAPKKQQPPAAAASGKSYKATEDLEEYDAASIADPLEPVNRVTFWVNHQLYTIIFRPVSKVYKTIVPKPVRTGVTNVFENAKFPVRLVNNTLQGNFKRAGQETGRFLVNTTVGVGGIGRPADHMPALADVPEADTGQTFAKWGIGHGFYLVLPILGPSSARDTVGLAGDYALNPVTWVSIVYGGFTWTLAIPTTNTLRSTPDQIDKYDAAIKNALDRYLAARSAYVQYRAEVKLKAFQ